MTFQSKDGSILNLIYVTEISNSVYGKKFKKANKLLRIKRNFRCESQRACRRCWCTSFMDLKFKNF